MNRGYIRLYRKIRENPVLHERGKRFSKFEAWIDLLLSARGTGDQETGLKRGEFEASYRSLARSWGWSLASVQRFLKDLQQGPDPMITRLIHSPIHSPIHLAVKFNICKYETYNPTRYSEPNANGYTEPNTYKNKGINKGKKQDKENIAPADAGAVEPLPSPESIRLSELLRKAIATRDPNAKAAKLPDYTHWARDIDKLLRIDKRKAEDCEVVIAWCQRKGCFWGPNILSGRKLREKFDTLYGQMTNKGTPKAGKATYDEVHDQNERTLLEIMEEENEKQRQSGVL